PAGHRIERGFARDAATVDLGMQQAILERQRLGERRALGAEAATIGGMVGIARDLRAAAAVRLRHDAAADAAIGTGRADRSHAARAWISLRRQKSKKVSVGPAR